MNEPFSDPSTSLSDDQSRQFDLQNSNSLSMVLNSEHGSSPQIYDFPPLDTSNVPNSTQRDVNGRLAVQSLLTLPPVEHSPSMQVMQIQPSLLDQSSLDLIEQRRLDRGTTNDASDPFDIRMTIGAQTHFGSGLSDVGANLQHPSSWADILLQPNTSTTFHTEIVDDNESLFGGNPIPPVEERPSLPRFGDSQTGNALPHPVESDHEAAKEAASPIEPPKRRKRRGKHSRYLAAQGKNGEPDKTHIDLLVTVIQKSETVGDSSPSRTVSEHQYETNIPSAMDDVSLAVLTHNSLPSIETLHLVDTATQSGQTAQGRTILDEMAGISSSEQPANNISYDMLDLFGQDDTWNGLMMPSSGGQIPLPVPYPQWNQSEYQEATSQPDPPSPRRMPSPVPLPETKRSRKSKRFAMEKQQESNVKTGEYICQHPNCTARFHQLQHLKTHTASHEGIKPFKCNFDGCDQTFTQKGNLKVHFSLSTRVNLGLGTSEETYWRETFCM